MTDLVPEIPASCTHRPTVGGLVAPYVNVRLADGGVDFRSPHTSKYQRCWQRLLCQTCGRPLPTWGVVFGGPNQLRALRFDEPPLCPPCAVYASQACPMVAGRQTRYADREPISQGRRGKTCPHKDCDCDGFVDTDPSRAGASGDPAHPWYACWVIPGDWALTVNDVETPCTEPQCLVRVHRRRLINGCQLVSAPRKIMLVSAPGHGRVWERATYAEACAT